MSTNDENSSTNQERAAYLTIPRTSVHPRYPPFTWVTVLDAIRQVHPEHILAGQTVRVCHGHEQDYPQVAVEIPGETTLCTAYTTGNAAIIPEVYIKIWRPV